jgi:hypothetical protein
VSGTHRVFTAEENRGPRFPDSAADPWHSRRRTGRRSHRAGDTGGRGADPAGTQDPGGAYPLHPLPRRLAARGRLHHGRRLVALVSLTRQAGCGEFRSLFNFENPAQGTRLLAKGLIPNPLPFALGLLPSH